MATIAAGLVKNLRDKTGVGMMDCKNALNETSGDVEAAVDWLRKKGLAKAAQKSGRVAADGPVGGASEAAGDWLRRKGLAKAAKKSGRVAADGLVGVVVQANLGVVAEVNSE